MDKLSLYRWAVQDPETHAIVLCKMYEQIRQGRQPLILREDFAGTSAESVAWVALRRGRRAIAVDLDGPTLDWAKSRARQILGSQFSGVQFVQENVLEIGPPEIPLADIISVLNYSILYLHERGQLHQYLENAFHGLAEHGILVLNIFGGSNRVQPGITSRRVQPQLRLPGEPTCPEFDYSWEVRSFDPARKRIDCRIHFVIADSEGGGRTQELKDAFQYDWHLWTASEVVDACKQSGFSSVEIWRHTYDPSKGEAGVFLGSIDPASVLSLDAWSVYVVACR